MPEDDTDSTAAAPADAGADASGAEADKQPGAKESAKLDAKHKGGGKQGGKATEPLEGVVKEYDPHRGLGLIAANNGEELSVHRNDLMDEALQGLYANDLVSFVIGRNRFGRRCAQQVRRVGWDDSADPDGPPREWTF